MNWIKKIFSKKESNTVGLLRSSEGSKVVWPQRGYDNFANETYLKNVTAFKAIDEVAKSVASVPWGVFDRNEDGSLEDVYDDPFNLILKRPNPDESFSFIMLKTMAYLVMCGEAFFERIQLDSGPNKGQLRELYSHRPDRFTFKITNGRLEKYIYTVNKQETEWGIDPLTHQADILQLKSFHPLDDWRGAAPTESAAREIDTSNAATEWNKSLLDNQGRPGMVFTLIGQLGVTAFDELERHLEQRSGPSFAGKDLILTGERGTGVQPYGWSPTDMDFGEGDLRMMRKIAMAYGVPPMLLGIPGEATFANYKEARLAFWESTVFWWLNYIRGELNNWLYPSGSNRFVNYILDDVPALSLKRDALWERAGASDFISINEKREMVGLDNWGPQGDVILIEASKIPLGMESVKDEGDTDEETRKKLSDEGYTEAEIESILESDYKNALD
jgi:HK97 family phage portal protein